MVYDSHHSPCCLVFLSPGEKDVSTNQLTIYSIAVEILCGHFTSVKAPGGY